MYDKPFISESKMRLALLHRCSDFAVIPLSAFVANIIVNHGLDFSSYLGLLVAMSMAIALWLYPALGLYRAWRGERLLKELLNATQAWTLNFFAFGFVLYVTGSVGAPKVSFFACWYLAGVIGIAGVRTAVRVFLNSIREHGHNKTHIIVIGDNGLATATIKTLRRSDWTGFNVLGHFGKAPVPGVALLGGYSDVKEYMEAHPRGVDQVWIAMPLSREKEITAILNQLQFATQDVRLVPGLEGFRLINNSVAQIADMPVLNLQVSPMTGMNRFVKAVEDRVLALLMLAAVSPLMCIVALGIKLTSDGPIFYRQERVSRAGKPFSMYKFRSMPTNVEDGGVKWGNASGKTQNRFGQFLRRTSLDELPQFINVLLGDMSIVGPRPERTQFVNQFKHDIDGYMQKHLVKAGITGWAQVNGWRGDTDLKKRIECDLHYINNWSVWMDLRIIGLTVIKGWFHENAK